MSSYAITGASRGIGWAFLTNLSTNPDNTVIALVRNKAGTEKRVAEELVGRSNIHVVHADLNDYRSLETAAAETAEITGGGLDYLIGNAAYLDTWDQFDAIGVLGENPTALEENLLTNFKTNVVAQIHLFNLFMPLILRGTAKKVIAITSGHADTELVANYNLPNAASYAISKVALNMAVAKFSAQYAEDGVLFLAICPGMVDTGHFAELTEEQLAKAAPMFAKFKQFSPTFNGARQPEDSVKDILTVIDNATVEKNAGGFLSHKGNRVWI
ncbi:uncharacterized protein BJX67DRAFT_389020 [Aspergillus lucknowensis]|uniref:Short chain dehydrogenase n=1 Tax=Aspergillus lucknowensis TaxID=176173 RepID=A0ABR4LMX7_9EURO